MLVSIVVRFRRTWWLFRCPADLARWLFRRHVFVPCERYQAEKQADDRRHKEHRSRAEEFRVVADSPVDVPKHEPFDLIVLQGVFLAARVSDYAHSKHLGDGWPILRALPEGRDYAEEGTCTGCDEGDVARVQSHIYGC
jgi:hypothetical protein